mmetsp:Transcript_26528/g.61924  ORF Transcript_26528/g.61924 Transcript_26528/m.61924 type:complete len:331 (-) Transcript_26528:57-1049(-)
MFMDTVPSAGMSRAKEIAAARRLTHRAATTADSMLFNVMTLEGSSLREPKARGKNSGVASKSQCFKQIAEPMRVELSQDSAVASLAVTQPSIGKVMPNHSPVYLNALTLESSTSMQTQVKNNAPRCMGPAMSQKDYLAMKQAQALKDFAAMKKMARAAKKMPGSPLEEPLTPATTLPPSPPPGLEEYATSAWEEAVARSRSLSRTDSPVLQPATPMVMELPHLGATSPEDQIVSADGSDWMPQQDGDKTASRYLSAWGTVGTGPATRESTAQEAATALLRMAASFASLSMEDEGFPMGESPCPKPGRLSRQCSVEVPGARSHLSGDRCVF